MIRIKLHKEQDDVAFDIDSNFRTAILGENGIGKSTILRAIADKSSQEDWLDVEIPKNLSTAYFSQIEKKVGKLSGGEHTKKRLEKLFSEKADIYVLDEPTNNLDSKNINWLKNYIIGNKLRVIFTSHDIDFIDNLAEIIFYLDSKSVEKTKDKCSPYLVARRKKIKKAFVEYENKLKKRESLLKASRLARQKSETGTKWEGGDNDKFLRGFNRNAAGKSASTARILRDRAEKIEIEKPNYDPVPRVLLRGGGSGKILFKLRTTSLGGNKIDLVLSANNKVIFYGENGTGKTTMIIYIISLIENNKPKENDTFGFGSKFSYVYLAQDWYENLDEIIVRNYLAGFGLKEQEMYNSLSYNNLDRKIINRKFKDLSPGVRIKVILGALSNKEFDLIIWDEPTNHLDVMTQSILLDAFADYSGALIVVSHDKQILSKPVFTQIKF